MTTVSVSDSPAAKGKSVVIRRVVLLTIIAGAAIAGAVTWWQARGFLSTDDAFVQADVTMVAPRIAGTVTVVNVQDNQAVKAGDVLFEIDAEDYEARLRQAQANLAAATAQVQSADAELTMTRTSAPAYIAQSQAALRAAQAQAERAQADLKRYEALFAKDEISRQALDQARTTAQALIAQAEQASAQLRAVQTAPQQTAAKQAMVSSAQAAIAQAQAALDIAKLQLSFTRVVAPSDGTVARRNVQVGSQLSVGAPVMALVGPMPWIVANFKETQLQHMRLGQPVSVKIDAYPGKIFSARVASLQMGTGSAFSLLPPENASGNFVKVVQRVPVKLVFDPAPDVALHLAPGMSVVPRVDIRDEHSGPSLHAVAP